MIRMKFVIPVNKGYRFKGKCIRMFDNRTYKDIYFSSITF